MLFRRFPVVFALLILLESAHPCLAQLSKGFQILLNRGLQLQGLVQWNDIYTTSTYSNANYTSINWGFMSSADQWGPAPGMPWSRWVADDSSFPPQGTEAAYMDRLFALQLGDEWNLQDGPTRTNLINWFTEVRTNWPNVILYHNNYAGQASDDALGDFIPKAQPDMLFFDLYPFQSVWDMNAPNHTGPMIGGPFTAWYSELRRYRQWGIAYGLPIGIYTQTFHAVQDYDFHVYRNPSPSELRLNNSSALAFNAKMLTGFVYNAGATSLFDILPNGYSGDTYTNALYAEQMDANLRARNLGKALIYLKPIYDLHNQNDTNPPAGPASGDPCACYHDDATSSIMFLQGRIVSGGVTNATPLPVEFLQDPQTISVNPANPNNLIYSWWEANKNDPYLNGWAVSNKGTNNLGLPGEVIIAWFTPLLESFDGPTYSNEVYMMVVNALTATNGSAADCHQQIKLNFLVGTAITSVNVLDPETGLVTTNLMPVIAGSGTSTKRQLVLDLDGGDAALFKFADGAPFVGMVNPARPTLSMQMQSDTPVLTMQGTVTARYQLQAANSLPATNWVTLTNLLLPSSPLIFSDTAASPATPRFYRAVGIFP